MGPKDTVIGLNKFHRLIYPVFLIALLASSALCWITITRFSFPVSTAWLLDSWLITAYDLFLTFALLIYLSVSAWKHKIILSPSGINVDPASNPFFTPFQCAYEEIRKVEHGRTASSIRIHYYPGNVSALHCGVFEGGCEAVIAELEKKIPKEKFEPDIRRTVKRMSAWDWARIASILMAVCGILAIAGILISREFSFPRIAWTVEDWAYGRQSVVAVSIDAQGQPWMIVRSKSNPTDYQLRHVTPEGTSSWNLPTLSADEFQSMKIVEGEKQEPWIILGAQLAHWEEDQWTIQPIPLDADFLSYSGQRIVARGSEVWGIDQTRGIDRIIQMELSQSPIHAREIPLPDTVDPEIYNFVGLVGLPSGALVAEISNGKNVEFHRYQNDQWPKITALAWAQFDDNCMRREDFTVDAKGQIWLLACFTGGKEIGKYDPRQDLWTWPVVEHSGGTGWGYTYRSIHSDGLGRIWISSAYEGQDLVRVYEEKPGDNLMEVRNYSPGNSSLEILPDSQPLPGPDGRMWAWNRQLVWIQSNLQDLPEPSADWVAGFNGDSGLIAASLSFFLSFLLYGGISALIKYNP